MAIYKSESRLPNTYQEVEYIESTGTQYIDTGVIADSTTGFSIVGQQSKTTTTDSVFIGSRNGRGSDNSRFYWDVDFSSKKNGQVFYGWNFYHSFNGSMIGTNKFRGSVNYLNSQTATLSVQNNTYTSSDAFEDNLASQVYSIYLFGLNIGNQHYNGTDGMRIFSAQITVGSALVRDFVPVQNIRTGAIGLYDKVNGVFYGNQGTGTFLKGNDVTGMKKVVGLYKGTTKIVKRYKGTSLIYSSSRLPSAYQEVEYVEGTGTQYIDLGITPTNTMTLELKFQADGETNGKIFGSRIANNNSAFAIYLDGSNSVALNFGNYYYTLNPAEDYNSAINTITSSISNGIMSVTIANENHSYTYQNSGSRANNIDLLLFAYYNNTSIASAGDKKIWYLKLFDSGNIIMNLVPCYRKSDNVVGMYDLVNDVFYTNAGTGTFIKGNDV